MMSPSPVKKIWQRKFLIAKKKSGKVEVDSSTSASVECYKCKKGTEKSKCLCVAYESLRASQEEFFNNRSKIDDKVDLENQNPEIAKRFGGKVEGNNDLYKINAMNKGGIEEGEVNGETGIKRRRGRQLKEDRECIPEPRFGMVMHLVKAFKKLLSIPKFERFKG
ncbi:Hypothetical predicted protein [Olea europaea subsp. europaea]|uniref:Uncharacterized protein n=1 Tax=Olea europaea subsp. europaea TaxID=158383 RepID=A0A8S0STS1_OLEEU|nr:Hypothetical predicted protein [Olea europaea subsp. europaea]